MNTLKYVYNFWNIEGDARISQYPMMNGGPWLAWFILLVYIYFVKYFGPKLMKDRKPFQLKALMIIYNLMMLGFNFYFFYQLWINHRLGIDANVYQFNRQPKNDYSSESLFIVWNSYLYLLTKYLDLTETIIFVFRKKFNQISMLHIYHHSIVPMLVYLFIKISPSGGPGLMFPMLNTFVHMCK